MKLKEVPQSLIAATRLTCLSEKNRRGDHLPLLPVIVSLTSIPSRLHKVHLTVRSLLAQTVRAEKIVLWLNDDLKGGIPNSLSILEGDRFIICYSPLTCSHRKLIHSLTRFPSKLIVTCDDDSMYAKDWLQKLYAEHLRFPNDIITNQCNLIDYDTQGNTLPYRQWKKAPNTGFASPALMPAGYGGVLYPVDCLHEDIGNVDLFLRLAPKADDLWFKAMSYLNGTLCRRAEQRPKKPLTIVGTQALSLGKTNIRQDKNREQWDAIRAHYDFSTPRADDVTA